MNRLIAFGMPHFCGLVIVLLSGVGLAHDVPVTIPIFEDDKSSRITLGEVNQRVDPGSPFEERQQLRQRCLDAQDAKLEACGSDTNCQNEVLAVRAVCDDFPETLTDPEIALGSIIICSNSVVPILNCGGANPSCPLGKDLDGDGVNDTCKSGRRCNPFSEGGVCDSTLLGDCHWTTTYVASVQGCDCDCE